ncbi:hypothetical protein K0U00_01860 [Paenibacillus sepulcri]|uniref:ILEI/PANDER domain-containing protein n=1 Tax=Paenibacillus sepulcri TaxID=359917 RepID=A0ABS7BVV5_9BACL|nr:hypothetical protein [Paenibacillus sepulcri]
MLIGWINILFLMKDFGGIIRSQDMNPVHEEADIEDSFNSERSRESQTPVQTDPFSRWEELLLNNNDPCKIIIESPLWDKFRSEYQAFAKLCEEKNALVKKIDTLWKEAVLPPAVYFDDPAFMSDLWDKNYNIELVKGRSLIELLKEVQPFSLIILSVKDDGTQSLNHKWQEQLSELGVHALTREHLRYGYVNIIWKTVDHMYTSLYEELSLNRLAIQLKKGDKIKDHIISADLDIVSAGFDSGNFSSIKIDGQEFSPNLRGINIVVYDAIDSSVEAVHRADTFVTIFDDKTIYRAYTEVKINAL